jgi:hypothetical protein
MNYYEWLKENQKQLEQDFIDSLQDQFDSYCESMYDGEK